MENVAANSAAAAGSGPPAAAGPGSSEELDPDPAALPRHDGRSAGGETAATAPKKPPVNAMKRMMSMAAEMGVAESAAAKRRKKEEEASTERRRLHSMLAEQRALAGERAGQQGADKHIDLLLENALASVAKAAASKHPDVVGSFKDRPIREAWSIEADPGTSKLATCFGQVKGLCPVLACKLCKYEPMDPAQVTEAVLLVDKVVRNQATKEEKERLNKLEAAFKQSGTFIAPKGYTGFMRHYKAKHKTEFDRHEREVKNHGKQLGDRDMGNNWSTLTCEEIVYTNVLLSNLFVGMQLSLRTAETNAVFREFHYLYSKFWATRVIPQAPSATQCDVVDNHVNNPSGKTVRRIVDEQVKMVHCKQRELLTRAWVRAQAWPEAVRSKLFCVTGDMWKGPGGQDFMALLISTVLDGRCHQLLVMFEEIKVRKNGDIIGVHCENAAAVVAPRGDTPPTIRTAPSGASVRSNATPAGSPDVAVVASAAAAPAAPASPAAVACPVKGVLLSRGTLDAGSNNRTMCHYLNASFRHCAAHKLALVGKDALALTLQAELDGSMFDDDDVPAAEPTAFEEEVAAAPDEDYAGLVDILSDDALVTHLKTIITKASKQAKLSNQSGPVCKGLVDYQVRLLNKDRPVKLRAENKTRWTALFANLSRALQVFPASLHWFEEHKSSKTYFPKIEQQQAADAMAYTKEESVMLSEFVAVNAYFAGAMTALQRKQLSVGRARLIIEFLRNGLQRDSYPVKYWKKDVVTYNLTETKVARNDLTQAVRSYAARAVTCITARFRHADDAELVSIGLDPCCRFTAGLAPGTKSAQVHQLASYQSFADLLDAVRSGTKLFRKRNSALDPSISAVTVMEAVQQAAVECATAEERARPEVTLVDADHEEEEDSSEEEEEEEWEAIAERCAAIAVAKSLKKKASRSSTTSSPLDKELLEYFRRPLDEHSYVSLTKDKTSLVFSGPDVLERWESLKLRFPILYRVHLTSFNLMATSCAPESLFSRTKRTQSDQRRGQMSGDTMHTLTLCREALIAEQRGTFDPHVVAEVFGAQDKRTISGKVIASAKKAAKAAAATPSHQDT